MEDEKANTSEKPVATPEEGAGSARKSRNLKDATTHLKEEALRRYKDKMKYDSQENLNASQPGSPKPSDENTIANDATTKDGVDGQTGSHQDQNDVQDKPKTPSPPSAPKPSDQSSRGSRPVTPKQATPGAGDSVDNIQTQPDVAPTVESAEEQSSAAQPGAKPSSGVSQNHDPVTDESKPGEDGKPSASDVANASLSSPTKDGDVATENTNNNADDQASNDQASNDQPANDEPTNEPAAQEPAAEEPTEPANEAQADNTAPENTSSENVAADNVTADNATEDNVTADNVTTEAGDQPATTESTEEPTQEPTAEQPAEQTTDSQGDVAATESVAADNVTTGDVPATDGQADQADTQEAPESQESSESQPTAEEPSDEVSPPLATTEPAATDSAPEQTEAPPAGDQQATDTAPSAESSEAQVTEPGAKTENLTESTETSQATTKAEGGEETSEQDVSGQSSNVATSESTEAKTSEQSASNSDVPSGQTSGDVTGEVTSESKSGEGSQETVSEGAKPEDGTALAQVPAGEGQEKPDEGPVNGEDPNIRGDEFEVQSDEVRSGDALDKIPASFFYDFADHVSKPTVTEESGLPADMLAMSHSFGYDCEKRANLHVLDQNHIMFAAGNVVEIVNLNTKKQIHIRSTSDGGIGAVAVHPSRKYIAVAEKGTAPNINIYTWPALKLHRILRGGTQEAYAYVDFSPDGELLASVGSDPDYMLTLWNWKQEQTVLRSKAFSQDVFRVSFSAELEGQLTSSGTGHIRFWKMADTFTGLKLQGQLGKFGKTEISDIEGYVELPDGKVLSGTEWGNMILWDGGLIKVEISRKGRKPCHQGPIQQIVMDEGELMTIGEDGFIRVWDFETIDTADTTDEDAMFEMEPMNELKVGHGHEVRLRGIVKCVETEEPTIWFAQDMNGGIWKLDLSFSHTSQAPEKQMTYHAGPIRGCATSPLTDLVATCGADSMIRVYDYMTQQCICHYGFNAGGSCILWAPEIVDTKGGTIFCGFDDGVLRVLNLAKKDVDASKKSKDKEDSELLLSQVLKPHTKKVTAMALDNKGETLATGGEDGTIFFLAVNDAQLEPIGFINIPGPVSYMTWSPGDFEKTTLLVTCQNGMVLEIDAPEPGTYDTEHSYLIKGLNMRTHQFKSIKSRLRHEEELERKRLEEEERKRQKEKERQKMIERGIEPPEEEEEEEEKPEEEEWKPFIPSEPSPIHFGIYSKEPGTFWLSVGDFDAGYLYECKFLDNSEKEAVPADQLYEPIRTIPVVESKDMPIVQVHFDQSHEGHQMIMGMQDGAIRIQPLQDSQDLSSLGPYWSQHMHDNHYGRINQIATSHDGQYLFTVGDDGNFFSYNFMGQKEIEEQTEVNKAKIPSAKKLLKEDDQVIEDIEDPSHYSIEDAKQKAEYDKMMKLAEEKKQGVRRTIAQLRRQFKKHLLKNEELPQHLQLSKKEFEMDPEIKKELDKLTNEKISLVKKEMAWDAEKHQIQLEKLRQRFKAVVECERIVVKSFQSPHEVSSFRAAKLSESFYKFKAEMERRRTMLSHKEATADSGPDVLIGQKSEDSLKTSAVAADDTQANIKTTLKGSMGERITKALEKVEAKRKKRATRKAEWDHLYTNKPDDDYEDPADVSAIKEAQDNMGDFKLKTADDYVVPDHLRMNVEKARFKLMILKDLIHEQKYSFNQKLLSLRDKKIKIIDDIAEAVAELRKVQAQLGPDKSKPVPPVPHLHPDEVPERKMQYTRESLLKFKEHYEKKLLAEKMGAEADSGGGGGFGGFGGGGGSGAAGGSSHTSKQTVTSMAKTPSAGHSVSLLESQGELENYNELLADESTMTELERRIKTAEEVRLVFKRDTLLNKITNMVKMFDAELRVLGHEKGTYSIELKNADLRHVTLFEELMLLKEYEKHENVLAEKLETKQKEKLDMQNKIIEVNDKVTVKKKEIEKLIEKEKTLDATFMGSLGDNNKFADYLTKVFKKKIKRKKAKTTEDGESDDESDDSSDDDDDDWDEDEESDSEGGGYDLDICPAGCDQTLYDNTCQLREKRLDIEEALAEEKKNRDQLNKDSENLQKKAKVVQAALKTAEADLEAFQLEKQRKLNELDIVVTLKLHQIQHVVNAVLPQDLSSCLVFELPDVTRLQHRIKELEHEKSLQKKQQKEAKKKHVNLIKDRKLFLSKIDEMNELCDKAMIDKFGRIVDLEQLEQVTVNRNIEELKEKLRINEVMCSEEVAEWERKISKTKDDITSLTRKNTERLEMLNMLTTERKVLQDTLDSRQKHLGGEYSGARKADIHERQRLIQLVQLQAQEVEALKEEIMLLSRKGGHILPPAQPPLPAQNRVSSGH